MMPNGFVNEALWQPSIQRRESYTSYPAATSSAAASGSLAKDDSVHPRLRGRTDFTPRAHFSVSSPSSFRLCLCILRLLRFALGFRGFLRWVVRFLNGRAGLFYRRGDQFVVRPHTINEGKHVVIG